MGYQYLYSPVLSDRSQYFSVVAPYCRQAARCPPQPGNTPQHSSPLIKVSQAAGWPASVVQTPDRDSSTGLVMADWKRILSDVPILKPPAYFESLLQT